MSGTVRLTDTGQHGPHWLIPAGRSRQLQYSRAET